MIIFSQAERRAKILNRDFTLLHYCKNTDKINSQIIPPNHFVKNAIKSHSIIIPEKFNPHIIISYPDIHFWVIMWKPIYYQVIFS